MSLATGPVKGLSIRNQLPGQVTDLAIGGANIDIEGGELTVAITAEAVADLGLTVGSPIVALVKSTKISLSA